MADAVEPGSLTVDVVIPAFNAGRHLAAAVATVIAQTHRPHRVIVVDDGSTDDTPAVIAGLAARHPEVVAVTQANAGPAAARHAGAQRGDGEFIAFLDSDDRPDPNWLETLVTAITHNGVNLVGGGVRWQANGIAHQRLPSARSPVFVAGAFIVRRTTYERVGGYDPALRYGENTELGWRLASPAAHDVTVVGRALVTLGGAPGLHPVMAEHRLSSAQHLLTTHRQRLANDRHTRGAYHAIAGVAARQLGRRRLAVGHLLHAVALRPGRLRYWGGLLKCVLPADPPAPGPRRVLHVVPSDMYRGAQVIARTLVDALGEHHQAVTLFGSPGGALHAEHHLDIPPGILRRIGFDPRAAWRLRRFVGRSATTVIAHGGEALKYATFARRRSTTVVYYKIGAVSSLHRRGRSRWLLRMTTQRADAVVAISHAAAHEARRLGTPDVIVIPNPRDSRRFRPIEPATPDVRLVFVGALTSTKRPDLFVEIVARLRARGAADIEATVYGDGPIDLTNAARAANVRLAGATPDIHHVLRAGDILVFPSVSEGEGMPGVLIEAGMCGLAVVATAATGVDEVVVDGETGFVRAVDDVEGLVDAVAALIDDPDRRRRMGAAARQWCCERFDIDVIAALWEQLLDVRSAAINE